MLSLLDDYCVHQTPDPIRKPLSLAKDAYDRYFANGFHRNGEFYFALALGRYPNRRVMDGALTFLIGGVHHSFFASRLDPAEPTETRLGELEVRIDSPMRVMTVTLAPNDSGVTCWLRWLARSAPLEEERTTVGTGEKVTNDATRWTQFGCWEGWFEIDGVRTQVDPALCPGVKDRSWGLRKLGDDSGENFRATQQLFWNWLPLNFGTFCVHSLRFEDTASDTLIKQQSMIAPLYEEESAVPVQEPDVQHIGEWTHDYTVDTQSRRVVGGSVQLGGGSGTAGQRVIEIGKPMLTAWTYAIGYGHATWNHGKWHGELATGHERWDVSNANPAEERYSIMHQVVEVRLDGHTGIGFVEHCIIGAYPRYGLGG